jgi:uncharacterized RDD family membrane protein YckC
VSLPAPGWYQDPAEPTTQRYWDGEGWVGDPLPAEATPPPGSPPPSTGSGPRSVPQIPQVPGMPGGAEPPPSELPPRRPGDTPPPDRVPDPASTPPGWSARQPPAPGGPPAEPHGYPLATPGARLLARLVDIGLVSLLNVGVNGWFGYQFWQEVAPVFTEVWQRAQVGDTSTEGLPAAGEQAGNLLLAMVVIAAALWFAYEVPAVANTGQTVGKRLLRIKVVRLESPDALSFGRSFRRWNTMGFPVLLWWCFGIGFLLQALDAMFVLIDRPLHQALHDKSAHTAVVAVPAGGGPSRTPQKEGSDESVDAS